jgi:hypothetical protein
MTVERKIVVGLTDIKAISFQCDNCEYRITMSPDKVSQLPASCLNGHRWISGEVGMIALPPLLLFGNTISKLRTLAEQKALGFKILLEFDEPKL